MQMRARDRVRIAKPDRAFGRAALKLMSAIRKNGMEKALAAEMERPTIESKLWCATIVALAGGGEMPQISMADDARMHVCAHCQDLGVVLELRRKRKLARAYTYVGAVPCEHCEKGKRQKDLFAKMLLADGRRRWLSENRVEPTGDFQSLGGRGDKT